MPARNTRQVLYVTDWEAQPPRRQEGVTRSDHAMAFWMGGRYSPDIPDHRDGSLLTGTWVVIPLPAPADVEPVFVYYDRSQPVPFEVHGQRYVQLGDAMEAAVGA